MHLPKIRIYRIYFWNFHHFKFGIKFEVYKDIWTVWEFGWYILNPYFLVFEAWVCIFVQVMYLLYSIFDGVLVTWYFMRYIIWLYFWHFVISCIGCWLISKRVTSRRMKSVFPGTRKIAAWPKLQHLGAFTLLMSMAKCQIGKTPKPQIPVSPKGTF